MELVESKLKENCYNPAITPIIYCGGGAVVMKLYVKTIGEHYLLYGRCESQCYWI